MAEKTDRNRWFTCTLLLFTLLVSGIMMAQAPPGASGPGSAFAYDAIQGNSLAYHDSIGSGVGHAYNPDAFRCFWICGRGRCFWSCRGGW